jgi:hypothetical protein
MFPKPKRPVMKLYWYETLTVTGWPGLVGNGLAAVDTMQAWTLLRVRLAAAVDVVDRSGRRRDRGAVRVAVDGCRPCPLAGELRDLVIRVEDPAEFDDPEHEEEEERRDQRELHHRSAVLAFR